MKKIGLNNLNFSALQELAVEGYREDNVEIDRILIEQRNCPNKCGRKLVYKGLSNAVTYKAFGVCEPCEYGIEILET